MSRPWRSRLDQAGLDQAGLDQAGLDQAGLDQAGLPFLALVLLASVSLAAGCQRSLMPTPAIYASASAQDPFADVPPQLRSATVDLLYATDRVASPVATGSGGRLSYGWERSPSVAFGSCLVQIGKGVDWDELVQASRTTSRRRALPLEVVEIVEYGRFPDTPHTEPEDRLEEERVEALLLQEVHRRLEIARRPEIFLFVHGYHNRFEDAACTAAEIWHFLGREGVPIVYSWPAGHGGLLAGYQYDQESGLFTVHHLKQFIEALASSPDVEGINILAHSRGTAVVVDTLGELFGAARAAGKDPKEQYRIRDLILAAADIDMMVATQRLMAERLDAGVGRATAYVSQHDGALSLSSWIFSDRRLGRLNYEDLTPFERRVLATAEGLSIVDVRAHTSGFGHDYFHSAPAASSDVLLVLRYDLPPGQESGRPLVPVGPNYWRLDDSYGAPPIPDRKGSDVGAAEDEPAG